jgi:hypothetical protein
MRTIGVWLTVAAAAFGLGLAVTNYLRRGSGVDHTAGAVLVIVSTAVLLALGLGVQSRNLMVHHQP